VDWFKPNWGNLASVLGLIISLITLWFAKRASQAANEAKAAVLQRNAADDLSEAARQAQDLLVFLRRGEWQLLRLKADELHTMASWVISRWGDKLDVESINRLTLARGQVRLVVEIGDRIADNSLSEMQKGNLMRAIDNAREIFVEEHGRFLARIS
jgi:hypothetical protein